jgi:hypothetical protein
VRVRRVRRHGDQDRAARLEQLDGATQAHEGVGEVLEDVEHQDERVGPAWLEALVEGADVNSFRPAPFRADTDWIHFDALDSTHRFELLEKETIAAAHIEDRSPGVTGLETCKSLQNEIFASSPPPVALKEIAVVPGVARVH